MQTNSGETDKQLSTATRFSIATWNVNGIRAVFRKERLAEFIGRYDYVCFQETKLSTDDLDYELVELAGYQSYWASCTTRKGYSGVAIYTKHTPVSVEIGLGVPEFDQEGRTLIMDTGAFVLINVYAPNSGQGDHRLEYKSDFNRELGRRMHEYAAEGRHVVLVGDLNVAYLPIDVHLGVRLQSEKDEVAGVTEKERNWFRNLLASGFIDTFRQLHPKQEDVYTYWDTYRNYRPVNKGWRIDYVVISRSMLEYLKEASTVPSQYGSDHCPAVAVFEGLAGFSDPGRKVPPQCGAMLKHLVRPKTNIKTMFAKAQQMASAAGAVSCSSSKDETTEVPKKSVAVKRPAPVTLEALWSKKQKKDPSET